jgi:hypothetical protein
MAAHFEDEVRRRLGATGAHFVHRQNRFTIGVANLLLRLKKVNAEYRTRNLPTQTSREYDAQLPLPSLPDFPRLTLGYRLSALGDQLLDVALVYAHGPRVEWVESLLAAPSAVQLPLRPARPSRQRVRVRPSARPSNESNGEG